MFDILHDHNLGIIADTGIALDIVALHPGRELREAMLSWIKGVVARIAPPCPRGKRVTMFISPGVYRDYRARLSRRGGAAHSSWHVLRKSLFTRQFDRQNRLVFTIQSVSTSGIDASGWGGDRYDRPFFALLESVRQNGAWADHGIIFASKDRDASARMRDLMALRDPNRRMRFADSLSACEELVMC